MGDRRVILIKGDSSKWYDEVIFIVKSGGQIPSSPVMEAERIVRKYIASKYSENSSVFDNAMKNSKYNLKKVDKIGKTKQDYKALGKAVDICLILILIALAALVFFAFS